MSSDDLRAVTDDVPVFRGLLVKYEQFFLAQVQQTAACNALHVVQAPTCKWLLRMHDLTGDDLPLTQEFLAQMMGVRRTPSQRSASELQKAGMFRIPGAASASSMSILSANGHASATAMCAHTTGASSTPMKLT
jgi:hypothetical protein